MRESNDDIDDIDDDIRTDKNLKKDEEWLHNQPVCFFLLLKYLFFINFKLIKQTTIFGKPRSKVFAPLNEFEVEEAKERRLKEIKMWEIFREILAYVMFLLVLYVVSFANMNSNSYTFQKSIQNIFVSQKSVQDYNNVRYFENSFF